MSSHLSHSLDETQKIAREWLTNISNTYTDSDEALVVGLSGHLGAGKTAFVKMIAKELGIKEEVTSPTFVIMKSYAIDPKSSEARPSWKKLIHIDAYRLEQRQELEALDFESLVADKDNLILMEWPEHVGLNEFVKELHLTFEIRDDIHVIDII